jgi:hypothetical protein
MGASTFGTYKVGVNVEEVFWAAVADAQYEHGHGGYSGTIAEKNAVTVIQATPIPLQEARVLARRLIREGDSRIDDKWGPAGAIAVGEGETVGWLFFGWASD